MLRVETQTAQVCFSSDPRRAGQVCVTLIRLQENTLTGRSRSTKPILITQPGRLLLRFRGQTLVSVVATMTGATKRSTLYVYTVSPVTAVQVERTHVASGSLSSV